MFSFDLTSFAFGAVVSAAAAFGSGFLKKAGEHAFVYFAEKMSPKPKAPQKVDGKFIPTLFAPGSCAWVRETKLYEYEEKGYIYYPHPKSGAQCFRITSDGDNPVREFLLVQPGAVAVVT